MNYSRVSEMGTGRIRDERNMDAWNSNWASIQVLDLILHAVFGETRGVFIQFNFNNLFHKK